MHSSNEEHWNRGLLNLYTAVQRLHHWHQLGYESRACAEAWFDINSLPPRRSRRRICSDRPNLKGSLFIYPWLAVCCDSGKFHYTTLTLCRCSNNGNV